MLPDDWLRCPLGKIARITSGGTPDRSKPNFWGGNIPWVTTGEIRFNTIVQTEQMITEEGLQGSSAKIFSPGTLLMAMYGQGKTRGQVAKLAIPAATNQACAGIILDDEHDPDFFFQVLSSQYESLRELGNSGTQKNLNGSIIKQIEVPVPSPDEQRGISGMLACWDSAITTVDRLLANSRKQRLSLLSRLLQTPASSVEVAERDRVGNHPPSVQAGIPRLSPMPRDWQRFKLREVLSEVSRPLSLMPQDRYALVTVKRSRGGVVSRGTLRGKEIKTASQSMVKGGDFLISKRQIVHGACGVVPCSLDGAVVSNEYSVLKSDGRLDLNFLRYLSESIYFQQTCFHSSIGVHVEKMIFNTDRWLNFEFNIPPIEEQRRIVRVLDCSASEIERLQLQIAMLRKEKQALMQQLLTGKRRVQPAYAAVNLPKTTSAKASVKTPVGKKPATRTPIAKDKRP